MKKWTILMLVTLSLAFPFMLIADECMEGDCDNGFGSGFTDDNKIYEGEWKNGLPHGQGTLYVSKGKVISGVWDKGELVKENTGKKEGEDKKKK